MLLLFNYKEEYTHYNKVICAYILLLNSKYCSSTFAIILTFCLDHS